MLVHAVLTPPMHFFSEVIRRRTISLYRHPHLHAIDSSPGRYVTDSSVSDGNAPEIVGGRDVLKSAEGVDGGSDGLQSCLARREMRWIGESGRRWRRRVSAGGLFGLGSTTGTAMDGEERKDEEEEEMR